MKIGIWYWHSPFNVSKTELGWLKKIGVSTIYVRAATFTTDGVHVKTMMLQTWKSNPGGMPIVLTFNFDLGLRSHFEHLPNREMSDEIVSAITRIRKAVATKGIQVVGIQMDVDCPTRLLPKYAELLTEERLGLVKCGALGSSDTYSATALQTWLNSRHYQELADATDFVTPQFYEGRVGKTVDSVQPIADTDNMAAGMARAESAGKPYFVGVATYGHALLYDQAGRLVGMYHGMQPEEALRHPSLKIEGTYPIDESGKKAAPKKSIGEDLLFLKAIHPDINGRGLGDSIVYVLPTAEMLQRELKAVRDNASSNCQGVILYRFPESADELNLPLETTAEAFAAKTALAQIAPKITRQAVPWSLIGTGRAAKSPPYDYTLTVKSTGSAPTLAKPGAVSLIVTFDRPGVEEVWAGDFDDVQTGILVGDGSFQPCAPAHANAVVFNRCQLLPGASIHSGAIEIGADGPSPKSLQWRVANDDGFTTTGGDLNLRFSPDSKRQ